VIASTEQIELAATATWSPDTSAVVDGWRVSSNGGFARRLNSATAIGQAETSLEAKRSVARWLGDRGGSLVVRVTPLTDPETARACGRNWYLEPRDETVVMTRAIAAQPESGVVHTVDPLDAGFVEEFFSLNDRRPHDDAVWSRMVDRIAPDCTGLWAAGRAVGFVAIHGTLAFSYSVAVHPSQRGKGLGRQVMAAGESWAAERGARVMVLQVLGTNTPARVLYERLGFAEKYRYHYLQAAPEGQGRT